MSDTAACPFCGFRNPEYAVSLHVELRHRTGRGGREEDYLVPDEGCGNGELDASPHARGISDQDEWFEYLECPVDSCDEILALSNLETHLELHGFEHQDNDSEESQLSAREPESDRLNLPPRTRSPVPKETGLSGPGTSPISNWKELRKALLSLSPPKRGVSVGVGVLPPNMAEEARVKKVNDGKNSERLGKNELGAHHNEDRMPDWLYNKLKKHGFKSSSNVIPVLAQLLEKSRKTQYAYLCDPATQHISKLNCEGSFCGYRNIQMLISYIVNTGSPGAAAFGGKIPDIFAIQDMIEKGWDEGINPSAREQVGVLRRTRKYIGTPEAQVLFHYLGIPHEAASFFNPIEDKESRKAENELYNYVENYFAAAPGVDHGGKVRNTVLPPIYLQHRGHSVTIIGIERTVKGGRNLLVFDPSYEDPDSVARCVGGRPVERPNERALTHYRRGPRYLGDKKEYEVVK
ncbi:DUF1671-domain-containing protein [Hypoxylon sp. FL0543]|nr:DUF1671-domain-containing protein [Hypoxylon sp. FL0543]